MQPRQFTSGEWARPRATSAGGVVAASDRRAMTYLLIRCRRWTPEIKRMWQRVEKDCEWKSPRAPSVSLLFRGERATPPFWSSWRTPGWVACLIWPSSGWRSRSRSWMRLRCGPRRMRGRERRVKRVGLAHPKLYFSFVSFVHLMFLQDAKQQEGTLHLTARARPG